MNRKSGIMRKLFTIMCISMFALTSLPLTDDSFAQRGRRGDDSPRVSRQQGNRDVKARRATSRRGKRRVISPRFTRHGHVVKKLPRGYRRAWYNRKPYYYRFGAFYRPARYGYTVVRPPLGVIVISLPVGYQRLWVDDSLYYSYGGIFYRRVPSGYVVVDPPPTIIVEEEAPALVQPSRPASGEVIVNAPVLNVRSGPSLRDSTIYQVDEGYILEVHGRSDGWLYVQLPNGEYGWIKAVFTKPLEPGSG